nr:MAG TPA: hypothetical protein [Caudoviricetes sp.]
MLIIAMEPKPLSKKAPLLTNGTASSSSHM